MNGASEYAVPGGEDGHGPPRLTGPRYERHGPALLRVVDVDWQEAAFVIMSVEQRELLMAVDDIAGVVDVQGDGCGLARILSIHQFSSEYFVGIFKKGVKYDAEGTGLGWATSATILAKDVDQPNTCKMKRPTASMRQPRCRSGGLRRAVAANSPAATASVANTNPGPCPAADHRPNAGSDRR